MNAKNKKSWSLIFLYLVWDCKFDCNERTHGLTELLLSTIFRHASAGWYPKNNNEYTVTANSLDLRVF